MDSFSFQWRMEPSLLYDERCSVESFECKTGVRLRELCGLTVLDAGCGSGRFLEIVSRVQASQVVGLDLSGSVEQAHLLVGKRPNVHVVHADLFHPPFRDGSFDLVFSLGVLHHTPNPKLAFQRLVPLSKLGGRIAVFVYVAAIQVGDLSSHIEESMSRAYRKITTKLPKWLLFLLCFSTIPLYHFRRLLKHVPRFGPVFALVVFMNTHPNWRWRILETFDWYSPKYQSKHTTPEVVGWFNESGLQEIYRLSFPVSVVGRRCRIAEG